MAAPAAPAAEPDWEASKENFQPLKTGRKAAALRDSTAELRSQAIEERRRAFWEELASYGGDDPLEVWLRFIKWTQETFSAGGHKAELLPLLERCTREMQATGKYDDDIRYLRVWIQYADCLPDPGDVFAFLKENNIGQEHALFYIAFSTFLEMRGNYARADSVYQQGINRLATPVERLRAKFQEFQQRMARRIQRKAQEQGSGDSTEPDHPERKSLGVLGGRKTARSGLPGGGLLGGSAGLKRKAADQENAPLGGGSGLDIFVDDEFSAGPPAASAPAALFQLGRSAAATSWTKLGGFEQNRKENVQRAGIWAGQKMKQQAAHSAPAAPALDIFVDPELQELEDQERVGTTGDSSKPTLRQRLDKGGAPLPEEELIHDPLHLHKVQAGAAAGPPLGGVPGRPDAQEAKRRREEVMAFDQAALLGSNGEELCFEEVRASRWLQQHAAQVQAAEAATEEEGDEVGSQPDMDLDGDTCVLAVMRDTAPVLLENAAPQLQQSSPHQQASPVPVCEEQQVPAAAPEAVGTVGAMASPDPVVAASMAGSAAVEQGAEPEPAGEAAPLSPVQQQLSQSPAQEHVQAQLSPLSCGPSPAEQHAEQRGFEPTMTVSMRDAFAAINQMFGGSFPSDADAAPAKVLGQSMGGGQAGPASIAPSQLDPTMTIATKDAFAALNKMFKGSLPLEHGTLPPNPYAEPTLFFARDGSGGGGMLDPTMTISTKAAFDAINSMFKGALPHEHGTLPPTAAGPASYDPTVTISTKAAFDAINQMFGGSAAAGGQPLAPTAAARASQQQDNGGFRVPAPRPPRSRPAPPAAAALAPAPEAVAGGFCIHEDTQFFSVPDDGKASGMAAAASPAASGGEAGLGGFCIHEDTQFITVPADAQQDDDEEEDRADVALAAGPTSSPAGPGGMAMGMGGGFCIHEDTQFITVPVQQQEEDSGEDAEEGGSGGRQAAATGQEALQAASRQAASPPAFGGFSIREDTQFIAVGAGSSPDSSDPGSPPTHKRPLCDAGGSTGDLLGSGTSGGHADSPAYSANAGQVNKWGFAPGADDTLALDLGDTQQLLLGVVGGPGSGLQGAGAGPAAAAAGASPLLLEDGGAPSLDLHMHDLRLSDCKENVAVEVEGGHHATHWAGGVSSRRRGLQDPGVAAAVLQPLAASRAAELGVEMEEDEVAEAQLATAGAGADLAAAEQDSFQVYADGDSDDCSPPLMGSPVQSGDSVVQGDGSGAEQEWQTPVQQQQMGVVGAEGPGGPALVDPFDPGFHTRMLSCLEPAVAEWPGVHCMSGEEEAEVEAGFKAAARSSAALVELQVGGQEFAVSGCIGEGAYAKVFQGVDSSCADVALKLEAPPCPWEWYICKALGGRLPPAARHLFVDPTALLLGARSSVLVAPLGPHGSLQDLLNAYLARQQTPPEAVAMYFAARLLHIVSHLHSARMLHTDIKPDNLLVTIDPAAAGDENAGPPLGLQLIDFGRSVDLELLPPGAMLQGDSGTDVFRCVEMREGRPWLWQADAYGVAATVYTLLYGQYMEVERVRDNCSGQVSLRLKQPFKRHWCGELWGAFFFRMLNHTDCSAPPAVDDLVAGFDAHLTGGREAARKLRQELSIATSLLPKHC